MNWTSLIIRIATGIVQAVIAEMAVGKTAETVAKLAVDKHVDNTQH